MLLYHGSNVAVEKPKLLQSDRKLDFGEGFYLTSSFEQAKRWAILTTKRRNAGKVSISVYNIDNAAFNHLRVLRFDNADIQWLRYVSANRKNIFLNDMYDVVIGPVANDKTMPVISLYFAGVYTEEEAIKRLLPQKLKDQYAFRTEEAVALLTFQEVISNG